MAKLSSITGVKPKTGAQLTKAANPPDLLQIRGIGSGYSNLLVEAGVHNVVKLAKFEPQKLHRTLALKNSALGNPISRLPSQGLVKNWIKSARMLAESEPSGSGGGRPGGGRMTGSS